MSSRKVNIIFEKLAYLSEYIEYLNRIKKEVGNNRKLFLDDFHYFGLAERYFQLSIQAVIDIIQLLIIEKEFVKPENNSEVISLLRDNKVLSGNLAERLSGMVGFRNILVHEYGKIDRSKVYEHLKSDVKDFKDFRKEIIKYLN